MDLHATASQTVGPYFSIGFAWMMRDQLAAPDVAGERVTLRGRVLDGDGAAVPDALIEIWQANSYGKYAHAEDTQDKPLEPGFSGFGRVATDDNGEFRFATIKPGSVQGPDGKPQAPHLVISVFARGLLRRLATRVYFPDEPANADDSVLSRVDPERRSTLIARKIEGDTGRLEWNVILQGAEETVFFDC